FSETQTRWPDASFLTMFSSKPRATWKFRRGTSGRVPSLLPQDQIWRFFTSPLGAWTPSGFQRRFREPWLATIGTTFFVVSWVPWAAARGRLQICNLRLQY